MLNYHYFQENELQKNSVIIYDNKNKVIIWSKLDSEINELKQKYGLDTESLYKICEEYFEN